MTNIYSYSILTHPRAIKDYNQVYIIKQYKNIFEYYYNIKTNQQNKSTKQINNKSVTSNCNCIK
jgi:hypothetical protein